MTLQELEKLFKENDFKGEIRLDKCTLVTDTKKFVQSHVKALKSNPKNKTYLPYWDRLIKLYKICANTL